MRNVFANTEDAIRSFGDGNDNARNASGNVYANNGKLYSYGDHFCLAIRQEDGYIINADTYSNTTSRQTRACIDILKPNCQLPFRVLRTARINPETVKLLEHKDDIWETVDYKDKKTGEMRQRQVHHLGGVLFYANGHRYISGFDSQESFNRHSYFLVRIAGEMNNYDLAIESLKPRAVQLATQAGLDVKRQGEYFFVPTQADKTSIFLGKQHPIEPNSHHIASEVRETANGMRLVRGTIKHNGGDHKRVTIGKQWHEVYKNTAIESFTAQGNLD